MREEREVGFHLGIGRGESLEQNFLENAQFVEYWHRQLHPEVNLPSRDRPSLRVRLQGLARDLPDVAIQRFTDDFSGFAQKVVTTRNYLIHLDPRLELKAMSGPELEILTLKLGHFLLFHTGQNDYGEEWLVNLVSRDAGSPEVRHALAATDKHDDRQLILFRA